MGEIITMAVLGERLSSVQEGLKNIQTELARFNTQALDRRLTTLESNVRWITRALVGFIFSVLAAVSAAFLLK